MLRSPGVQRAKALVLLLVLLTGGFGLPVVDGLWFHAKAVAAMAPQDQVATADDSGSSHLLGCAVWSSPAASTGLPEVGTPLRIAPVVTTEPPVPAPAAPRTQFTPTLALPRAPPSV